MNNNHRNKMIAPIIITVIFILYFLGYFAVCIFIDIPLISKLVFGLVPLALIGISFYVLAERIKEIRSGEEDDLSKY